MKCLILFSWKNKNIINVLSAELAQRVVKVNDPDQIVHVSFDIPAWDNNH